MKKKINILMIEDFKHDYLVMERTLQKSDIECKIEWVQRGEKGIQKFKSGLFDIVIIDYKLPDENGLEVFRRIKKIGIDIPVVFIAASGNECIAAEAIKLGAQDYIVKDPLGRYLDVLPGVIKKALSQWEAEQERKQAEKALKATNEKLTMLAQTVTSMKEYVSITNMDDKIIFVNQALLDKYGYKRDEILGKPTEILRSTHNPKDKGKEIYTETLKGGWRGELLNQTKDGKEFPIELSTSILKDENGKSVILIGIAVDITERKQAEQIQSVLYNIADATNTTKDLNELFVAIREYLGTIVDTTNFYIALYDKETDIISLPYAIDEMTQYTSFPAGKTLTSYVIKLSKSLLATQKVQNELINSGEVEILGEPSKVWLGVPLKRGKNIIGLIAVHSYKDPNLYTEKDKHILEFVSGQIAVAIERKQAEKALKESEERLSAIFESARDGIVLVDKTGKIIKMNERITEVAGYTQEDIVGNHLSLMKMFTLKDLPRLMTDFAKIIAGVEVTPIEYRLKTKKGLILYVEIHGSAVKENGKIVGAVGLLRDITERKQAEEQIKKDLKEKDVMLKEIYHRVKNNMQVIISLLNLQSRNIKDNNVKEMFNICKNRIFSMSLVHERLYGSKDLASIDFQPYIKSLTTHLLTTARGIASNIQIDVNAEDITLDVNKAIPCGLIINELISNAFKHAFPFTADKPKAIKGKVNVKMYKDKEGKYNLIIQDDGIGFPEDLDFRNTQSLGLQLVMGLTQQIDGNIDLEIDGGSKFKIVF
ncbi:PAS domain S-box protein [candidate division WOR-3 bacterium]|nr:PAS domain S-box protein [candidate division WOR-3 bacterium]